MNRKLQTVVFDVGGVLLDWDPRHLYRSVFDDDDAMARFFDEVCTWEWHFQHDAGVPFSETIPALCARFPEHAEMIKLWETRYLEMVAGEIPGVVEVVRALHDADRRLIVLSNMPSEMWPQIQDAFPWFSLFDAAIISGDERIVKPDPAIYRILVDRFGLDPATTAFVDDRVENVDAARSLGFEAVLFSDADALRGALGLPAI